MSYPQQSSPISLDERVAKLEADFAKSNKNMTDGLQALIDKLEEMREEQCDLPPGCAS